MTRSACTQAILVAAILTLFLSTASLVTAADGPGYQDSEDPGGYLHDSWPNHPAEARGGRLGDNDTDGDGIADYADNCSAIANASQLDSNGDGYGNACDPDLDNNGIVNFLDLQQMQVAFFSNPASPGWNPDADFNGDSFVNFLDLQVMQQMFFGVPGPSGFIWEQMLRDLIAAATPGTAQVETVLDEVARGRGLPLRTASGGYLFVCACGDAPWELAGDHNAWMGNLMNRNGELFWLEVVIANPVDAGYKFHDGAVAWIADPRARRYLYDTNGELSLVEADQAHLERWPGIASHNLLPRTVRVWVPAAGAFDRVLYAHDGQNLFDPDAIWGGWHLQDSLPAGILVVALDNTAERIDEYTHVTDDVGTGSPIGGNADDYAAFITDTVRPMMDAHYGAGTRYGLIGSSLGGLVSLVMAEADPTAWDFAASLSGTVGWGSITLNNETIIERFASAGTLPVAIYVDSGGSGTCFDADSDGINDDDPTAFDNYCENIQLRDTLDVAGWTFGADLWHWHEPGAPHNELAWRVRVWRPLEVFSLLP